jgi:hypothetical protein
MAGKHTKSGHVTLLKAYDDEPDLAAKHTKTGHVTLLKAFDDDGEETQFLSKKGYDAYQALASELAFEKGDKPTQGQFSSLIDSYATLVDDGRVWPQPGNWSPSESGLAVKIGKSRSNIQNNRVIPLWGLPPGIPMEAAYSAGKKEFKGHVTLLK